MGRDLVDDAGLERAKALVSRLTGGQPVLVAEHAQLDAALLFPPDPEGVRRRRRDPGATGHEHEHQHERFTTTELAFEGPISSATVRERIAAQGAIRAKGFVQTEDGLRVVQGVGPRIELSAPSRPVPEALIGKVVVIHRDPSS